jgi:hypothetical protein
MAASEPVFTEIMFVRQLAVKESCTEFLEKPRVQLLVIFDLVHPRVLVKHKYQV